jgi:hypothetical protein
MTDDIRQRSEQYVDDLFGPGMGARHGRFLDRIESEPLRDEIDRYHVVQSDTSQISLEEHYLLATCVLCATRAFGSAQMFVKTLRHLGVSRQKIVAAVGRLSMWIGGIPAVEALAHVKKALDEYERDGERSMAGWFPEETGGKHGVGNGTGNGVGNGNGNGVGNGNGNGNGVGNGHGNGHGRGGAP